MSTFYNSPNDYRSYLAHHGVKGMKWGVRKQYYADLKRRRKLGRAATIADHSIAVADYKIAKIKKKIEKHGTKDRYISDLKTNKWIKKNLKKKRNAYEDALHAQVAKMQKAYGTKIKDVKYNKYGRINERVVSGKDIAKSVAASLLTTAASFGISAATGGIAGAGLIPGAISVAIPSSVKIRESDYNNMYRSSYSNDQRKEAVRRMYEELDNLKKEK